MCARTMRQVMRLSGNGGVNVNSYGGRADSARIRSLHRASPEAASPSPVRQWTVCATTVLCLPVHTFDAPVCTRLGLLVCKQGLSQHNTPMNTRMLPACVALNQAGWLNSLHHYAEI